MHLVNKVGFTGVHPRKSYMYLNLRTEHAIASARVVKTEQVSKTATTTRSSSMRPTQSMPSCANG
jgi:hypothetical protein